MNEVWKPAPGLKGLYEISSIGRFRRSAGGTSAKIGKILRGIPDKNGYMTRVAYLGKKGDVKCIKFHRLVVGAFIREIPPGMQVNHKNGVKNDNRVENLEIVTPSENTLHGFRVLGRVMKRERPPTGESHHNSRWKDADIIEMRRLYSTGVTQVEIAKRFHTIQSSISKIIRLEAWKHLA